MIDSNCVVTLRSSLLRSGQTDGQDFSFCSVVLDTEARHLPSYGSCHYCSASCFNFYYMKRPKLLFL